MAAASATASSIRWEKSLTEAASSSTAPACSVEPWARAWAEADTCPAALATCRAVSCNSRMSWFSWPIMATMHCSMARKSPWKATVSR